MTEEWILVLGANSDIAEATARRLALDGCNVHLASRNICELEKEAAHLNVRFGVEARAVFFDALDFDSHAVFYAGLSPKPVGVIVAFGMLGDHLAAQRDFTVAKAIMDTNYCGAVSILEVVAADFERRKSGFIVGISSVAGDRGRKGNYIYGSAKAGFSAYLSGLRQRLSASGVSVLNVKPGFVATKMTAELGLPGILTASPQDVAEKIVAGIKKKKNILYVKPVWRLIMWVIIHLPEYVFKRVNL